MPYIKIIRPINIIFVILTTIYGALYPNFDFFNKRILYASISAALISAAGYVVNDYFDRYIDKINRPDRMIPSGKISPYTAYMYGMFLFIVGISLSFFTQKAACVIMAFINTFLLFFYAKKLKNGFLLGNILVAYAAASTFIYGAFVTGNLKRIIPVIVVAFLFTIIREFIKDAQDFEGDKKMGAKTIAVIKGRKQTVAYSMSVAIFMLLVIFYLFYINLISLKLLLLLEIVNILPVLFVIRDLYKKITDKNFSVVSNFLKFEMLLVIIIFYIGK